MPFALKRLLQASLQAPPRCQIHSKSHRKSLLTETSLFLIDTSPGENWAGAPALPCTQPHLALLLLHMPWSPPEEPTQQQTPLLMPRQLPFPLHAPCHCQNPAASSLQGITFLSRPRVPVHTALCLFLVLAMHYSCAPLSLYKPRKKMEKD